MLNNQYYSYYKFESYIHKSNAIFKIFNFLILITLLISPNYINVLSSILVVTISCVFSCVPGKKYIRYLYSFRYAIILFIILLAIIQLNYGVIILAVSQLLAIILYGAILTYTTSIIEIIDAISCLLKPFRLLYRNYKNAAISIGIIFSSLSFLLDSKNIIIESQSSRGNDYRYRNVFSKFAIIVTSLPNIIKLGYEKMKLMKNEIIKKGYLTASNNRAMNKLNVYDILFGLVLICSLLYLFIGRIT